MSDDASRMAMTGLPWLRGLEPSRSEHHGRLSAWSRYMESFEDTNSVIELTLTEARDATRADGGTVYLVTHDSRLRFAYFQNDTLSRGERRSRDHYINAEMPLSESSIAGYAALSKRTLNIEDTSDLPPDAPYTFNRTFDEQSGYRTVSILTVPMLGAGSRTIAVLQLINCLDGEGVPRAFGRNEVMYAELLAANSAEFLVKSLDILEKLDGAIALEEHRARYRRVGSFAAEIYESVATRQGVSAHEMLQEKDRVRVAAMQQDALKSSGASDADTHQPDRASLFARITTLADALGGVEGASFEHVLGGMMQDHDTYGKEVVEAAAAIGPTLAAIADRYAYARAPSPAGDHRGFIA